MSENNPEVSPNDNFEIATTSAEELYRLIGNHDHWKSNAAMFETLEFV